MRVLLLSPYPHRISKPIEQAGDEWYATADRITPNNCNGYDMLVSFGYRHILPQPILKMFGTRAVNVHIALLPWNKGAHPNFWAWYDGTPHGVTIHVMDAGIDTGPIIASRRVEMNPADHTFASSYDVLMAEADALFALQWPRIRTGQYELRSHRGGSFHFAKELPSLADGWNSPVSSVTRQKDAATSGLVVPSNVAE